MGHFDYLATSQKLDNKIDAVIQAFCPSQTGNSEQTPETAKNLETELSSSNVASVVPHVVSAVKQKKPQKIVGNTQAPKISQLTELDVEDDLQAAIEKFTA